MTPVRLEPVALRSRVKRSTTEALRSQFTLLCQIFSRRDLFIPSTSAFARRIPQRTIYTFYELEVPWNTARDICEEHFGQLIKMENAQQEMEAKLLTARFFANRT